MSMTNEQKELLREFDRAMTGKTEEASSTEKFCEISFDSAVQSASHL